MPSVDCWSLLGIPCGASADEVKQAYARRVRDVHPDSGGTGDGLTMSLLKAARDEALGQARQQGMAFSRPPKPVRAQKTPKVRMHSCNVCGQSIPRDQLGYFRIHSGFHGRPKSTQVLVCASCTHIVATDKKEREWKTSLTA